MIQYFTGVMGSGKTYFAVDYIYRHFTKNKENIERSKEQLLYINLYKYFSFQRWQHPKSFIKNRYLSSFKRTKSKVSYDVCFTNINEFKFDKLNNVHYLDIDQFEKDIQVLHKFYKTKVTDKVLNERAKDLMLYKALIVVDECHNLFDVKKPHLVWWLTYHRHMYQDIILITQEMSLIESKYKNIAEAWYKAKPKSLTISSKYFVYDRFINSRMFKNAKSGSIRVLKSKNVFDLYHSGDVVNTSNILHKFIIFAVVLAVLLYLFFKVFNPLGNDASEVEIKNTHDLPTLSKPQHVVNTTIDNNQKEFIDIKDKVYVSIYCDDFNCEIGNINVPVRIFNKVLKHLDYEKLGATAVGTDIYKLHLLIENDYLDYFPQMSIDDDMPERKSSKGDLDLNLMERAPF